MLQQVSAIVSHYRRDLAYFQGLQQMQDSTWTDADVRQYMGPHRAEAERTLTRLGLDADQVAELLAEPEREPTPARTLGEHMNRLIRGGST
jgi:hypothetical protein